MGVWVDKKEDGTEAQQGSTRDLSKYLLPFTIAAIIFFIITTIYFRLPLAKYFGFYEPDGFYHYSVIRAAVNNHFVVPHYLIISGWPHDTIVNEPVGFYLVTLIPYAILQYVGLSYYTVMRYVPILFAIFDGIAAYYLAKELNKDRFFCLLVMVLIGLSMGDAARTSATIYRGDGFVTVFLISALVFMLRATKATDQNKRLLYSVISGIALGLCNLVWNGALFVVGVYMLTLIFVAFYAFLVEDRQLLKNATYLPVALVVWFAIILLAQWQIWITAASIALSGPYIVPFLAVTLLLFVMIQAALFFINNAASYPMFMSTIKRRFASAIALGIVVLVIVLIVDPNIFYSVFVENGFGTTSNFAATIQELQPPTPAFLYASFGPTLFLTPMSILLYVATYFPVSLKDIFLILLTASFGCYFFMTTENVDEKSLFSGQAVIKFRLNESVSAFAAFYLVTAYLQLSAVRFNSLLSVPLAIFTAYTIYWVMLRYKNLLIISSILLIILLAYIIYTDQIYTQNLVQADDINPQFIAALNWLKSSTPNNTVILTLWPDGSLVEGVANRTSVTDSVGSQNASKANPFAAWIFNSTPDPQFLTSNVSGRPDYLMVRYSWLLETSGIYTESGYNSTNFNQSILDGIYKEYGISGPSQFKGNVSNRINQTLSELYGYNIFTSVQESANQTNQSQSFIFENQGSNLYAKLSVAPGDNGLGQSVNAYAIVDENGQDEESPFSFVGFYNQLNNTYSIVRQTQYNATNNQLLLVEYSPIPNPTEPVNVTGVYLFNTNIASSNLIKFLFFCSADECSWDNNVATLSLVYANYDTKIFKINYNDTSGAV